MDDEDVDWLSKYRWRLRKKGGGKWCYAEIGGGRSMHRMLLSPPRHLLVDHIDGNGLNNTRSNLRIVTHGQNQQNTTSSKNQKIGGFKGVHWNAKRCKWRAQIRIPNENGGRGEKKFLGEFDDPIEAARAYDEASRRYHTHGCQNFQRLASVDGGHAADAPTQGADCGQVTTV